MKRLLTLLLLFNMYLISYSVDMLIEAVADEAKINFENEEFSAKGGLKTKYEDVKIQANKIKKVKDKNIIVAHDKIYFEQQDQKVEAEELRLRLDDKTAIIKDGKSYTKIEGDARAPHDRIYYGGEKFEARFPNKAIVRNAYFSTCSHIVEGKEKADYRLDSKKIVVYVGKRLVAYNNFLYIKNVPVLWLPVYVTSLKSTADGAPLFPRFGADADGSYVIWGLDYGEDDSKYLNGSAALKWSSKKGWVLDSWNNVYTIEKGKHYGSTQFTDTYPFPKSGYEKEWKFTHKHHYGNNKGNFDWEYQNESTSSLNDESKDYLTNSGKATSDKIVVYKLNTDFKEIPTLYPEFLINLGQKIHPDFDKFARNGTYTLKTEIEWTDQKDIMKTLGEKEDEDGEEEVVGYTKPDRKVLLDTTLTKKEKSNRYDYSIHYRRLEDFNPGNLASDKSSKEETQGYKLNLNKYKAYLGYDMTDRDVYRPLTSSEKEDLERKKEDAFGEVEEDDDGDPIYINEGYEDVEAIKQYDIDKNETYKANIGNYEIFNTGIKWGAGYAKNESEKKLNQDTYINSNDEEVLFNESSESRPLHTINESTKYTSNLEYKKTKLDLGYSKNYKYEKSESQIEGEADIEKEEDYKQKAAKITNNDIDIKYVGKLGASYEYALDKFSEKDEREKNAYNVSWARDWYDTKGNPDSTVDLKFNNKIGYKYQAYSYDIGDRIAYEEEEDNTLKSEEEYWEDRLNGSSYRMTKGYDDTATFELGNTKTIYNFKLDRGYNGYYYDWQDEELLEAESISNSVTFNIDNNQFLNLKISNKENYDDRKPDEEKFKNADTDSFSTTISDKKYGTFTYSRTDNIRQRRAITDSSIYFKSSQDTSLTNTYKYSYGSWNTSYSDADIYNQDFDYLGNEKTEYKEKKNTKTYTIGLNHGDVINRNGNISFTRYKDYEEEKNNKNTIKFNFTFTDKRDEVADEIEKIKKRYVDEENKDKFMLSDAEKAKILELINESEKKDLGFNLKGMLEEASDDAKKSLSKRKVYKFELELVNSPAYQDKSDYWASLTKIVVGPSVEYHNMFFSYKYTQNRNEAGGYVKDRLHYTKGAYSFGKNDQWNLSYSMKYNDARKNREEAYSDIENKKLKSYEIEIEKNFHCTVLGLSYGQELTEEGSTHFYESLWTFRFGLLTFPEKKLGLQRVRSDGEYVIEQYLGM